MGRVVVLCTFFGVFLIGGILAGWSVVKWFPQARASSEWPTVDGQIVTSQLVRRGRADTRLRLEYEYQVGEQWYFGSRSAFMDGLLGPGPEVRARRYPQGSAVQVHYSPDDPTVAVLEPGVRWIGFGLAVLISGFFTLIGGWGVSRAFRPKAAGANGT